LGRFSFVCVALSECVFDHAAFERFDFGVQGFPVGGAAGAGALVSCAGSVTVFAIADGCVQMIFGYCLSSHRGNQAFYLVLQLAVIAWPCIAHETLQRGGCEALQVNAHAFAMFFQEMIREHGMSSRISRSTGV
jgi:hypothetical protein